MTQFEDVLIQYEPMISASLRQLNIYRDHEKFKQAGRIALWQAWTRYEKSRGHFAPFASISIRGAMLDELKRERRFEEHVAQSEDDFFERLSEIEDPVPIEWSDRVDIAFDTLNTTERKLIQWLFIERLTQAECAEKAGISIPGIKKRREKILVKLSKVLN